jgi:hypothetical protein
VSPVAKIFLFTSKNDRALQALIALLLFVPPLLPSAPSAACSCSPISG